jgi:hypothetical protein
MLQSIRKLCGPACLVLIIHSSSPVVGTFSNLPICQLSKQRSCFNRLIVMA